MVSQISKDDINDYQNHIGFVIESNEKLNEATTRYKMIDRLLFDILGWGLEDVSLEHPITVGTTTHSVDYAFVQNGDPELYVEAKKYPTNFSKSMGDQIQSYLKQDNVSWGLLTDGFSYKIYNLEVSNSDIVVNEVFSSTFEQLNGNIEHLSKITKYSLTHSNEVSGSGLNEQEGGTSLISETEGSLNIPAKWSNRTVRDSSNINMYLPPEVAAKVKKQYVLMNAEFIVEHGRELEKNTEFYPLILEEGLKSDSLRQRLGLQPKSEY